jgi:type II secretory pathway pseudopilin PulG
MVNGKPGRAQHRQAGFTYVGLLIAVAVIGVWLSATAQYWHVQVQRDKEQELLATGHEFRKALASYASGTQGAARRLPPRLEDLLLDDRFLQKKRHLRRIPVDPMTGSTDWGLIRTGDGLIQGVHSLSEKEPIKKAGFDLPDIAFTEKTAYSQWVFLAAVRAVPARSPARAP